MKCDYLDNTTLNRKYGMVTLLIKRKGRGFRRITSLTVGTNKKYKVKELISINDIIYRIVEIK